MSSKQRDNPIDSDMLQKFRKIGHHPFILVRDEQDRLLNTRHVLCKPLVQEKKRSAVEISVWSA